MGSLRERGAWRAGGAWISKHLRGEAAEWMGTGVSGAMGVAG